MPGKIEKQTKVKTKSELAKINSRADTSLSFVSEGAIDINEARNDHEVKLTATADGEVWLLPNKNRSPINLTQPLSEEQISNINEIHNLRNSQMLQQKGIARLARDKVDSSSIVDSLDSSAKDLPLSANQGRLLDTRITVVAQEVEGNIHASNRVFEAHSEFVEALPLPKHVVAVYIKDNGKTAKYLRDDNSPNGWASILSDVSETPRDFTSNPISPSETDFTASPLAVATPTQLSHAATKAYVDEVVGAVEPESLILNGRFSVVGNNGNAVISISQNTLMRVGNYVQGNLVFRVHSTGSLTGTNSVIVAIPAGFIPSHVQENQSTRVIEGSDTTFTPMDTIDTTGSWLIRINSLARTIGITLDYTL